DIFCLKPYDLILRRVFWDTSWYGLDTLILLERCRGYAAQPTGTTDMKLMSSADYASTPASGHRHEEAALPRDIDHRSTHNMAPSSARVPVNGQNGIAPQSVQDRTSAKKAGEVDPCPYDLSREDREQIYHIATAISFRRGTTIFSQGADAHFIYFIDQGIVRLSRFAENGHRQVLGFQVA